MREPPSAGVPPPGAPAFTPALAAGSELLLAALTFFSGLTLLLAIPGLQTLLFAGLDAVFGRPDLPPEKIRQAHQLVLTSWAPSPHESRWRSSVECR